VYRGQEVGEFLQAWADSWRKWHFDVEDVRDAEGEHVFVAIHEWGIGVESGVSVDQRRYFAVTVRAGRAVRVRMFSDRADALAAVGLAA
jgi:ketosteroid isomerase-like protein